MTGDHCDWHDCVGSPVTWHWWCDHGAEQSWDQWCHLVTRPASHSPAVMAHQQQQQSVNKTKQFSTLNPDLKWDSQILKMNFKMCFYGRSSVVKGWQTSIEHFYFINAFQVKVKIRYELVGLPFARSYLFNGNHSRQAQLSSCEDDSWSSCSSLPVAPAATANLIL